MAAKRIFSALCEAQPMEFDPQKYVNNNQNTFRQPLVRALRPIDFFLSQTWIQLSKSLGDGDIGKASLTK